MENKFVNIEGVGPSPTKKTFIYAVKAKSDAIAALTLGTIKWYGAWRKYVFHPAEHTLFDHHCLREIAEVCDQLSQAFRKKKVIVFQEPIEYKHLGIEKCVSCAQPCETWYLEKNLCMCTDCATKEKLTY